MAHPKLDLDTLDRRQLMGWVSGALLAAAAPAAWSQDWPNKAVRLLVGFPPGAIPDIQSRLISDKLSPALGQPLVVVNQPGAAGAVAANALVRAPADGYSLMMGTASSLAVAPHVFRAAAYDPVRAFEPIGVVMRLPFFITVRRDLPIHDLRGLVDYARKNPGKLNYATPGIATLHHLAWELLQHRAGISLTHVPMQAAQQMTELMAGRVDVYMDGATASTVQNMNEGKFRFIAMTGSKRMAAHPSVPSLAESGVTGAECYAFNGLVGPAGLPKTFVARLNAELNKALVTPEMLKRMEGEGVAVEDGMGSSPQEFADLIRSEYAKWGAVIKTAGIRLND